MMDDQKSQHRNSRILVVDDIEQNRELLEAHLSSEGYQVESRCAADGIQENSMVSKALDLVP